MNLLPSSTTLRNQIIAADEQTSYPSQTRSSSVMGGEAETNWEWKRKGRDQIENPNVC